MKLHESFDYPADADAVYGLITDAGFREDATISGGGKDVTVTVEPDGEGATVTVVRTMPNDGMPDAMKRLAGASVTIKQVERWGAPEANGGRKAKIKLSIIGQPAGMEGTASITPDGKGSAFSVSGDVKVNVPFLGRKIEPMVAKAITASLRHEVKEGTKRL
jgi:hypothetical protein